MLLICADASLSLRLGRLVEGQKVYALTVADALRVATLQQPAIILLDVRLGGSGQRAVEVVPALLAASPASAVLVITRAPTEDEIDEADALGAYDCIDRLSDGFVVRLQRAISLARSTASHRGRAAPTRAVH